MAKNWAIIIGVNQYDNLSELRYAQRDAELMRDYFLKEAGFEKVYYFSDNSPPIADAGKPFPSQPTYAALKRFLRVRFNQPFLKAGDNLWFFFSGHGLRHTDRDYLMPSDADPHPDGIEDTAIPINYITERLRRCGADNVVLLLDACRNEQSSKGLGVGEEKQQGVITIASCSPAERSYEIENLQQGSFTCALLEALRIQGEGNCATVERLYQRLCYRVSEINNYYKKPRQTPYVIAEPATKYHLILLPKQATDRDIATLKSDAFKAEAIDDLKLAEQLWTRVIAVSGDDQEALSSLRRIWGKTGQAVRTSPPTVNSSSGGKSPTNTPLNKSKLVNTVTNSPAKVSNSSGIKSPTNTPPNKPTLVNFSAAIFQSKNKFFANIRTVIFLLVGAVSIAILPHLDQNLSREDNSTSPIENVTQTPKQPTQRKTASPTPIPTEVTKTKTPKPSPAELLNADYSQLENFLKKGNWKETNRKTSSVMLKVAKRESQGWLDKKSVDYFSCSDLKKIDRLWVKYSKGRFGFSVQKVIWLDVGGKVDLKTEEKLGDRIGWRKEGEWLSDDKIKFGTDAPKGHLPRAVSIMGSFADGLFVTDEKSDDSPFFLDAPKSNGSVDSPFFLDPPGTYPKSKSTKEPDKEDNKKSKQQQKTRQLPISRTSSFAQRTSSCKI